ncbi:hypothetical protein J2W20_000569 [Sinomonas atrocyanea]|uniref:hypothetical protein n=1 Tax=Sinomonas atrocyanea TaxID=37927 RepID=UPI00278A06F0|nr:hypothetical protein [Sinomonas atrocyanea]MDQ0258694.1 hypothetical protein [Sinomonas atrocyanea]
MGEFLDRRARVSAVVAAAVILASAVAAALSEETGIVVWAASGVLGLVYGFSVVWSVRRSSRARAATPAVAPTAAVAVDASAQAVAAAEQVLAEAVSDAAPSAPTQPAPAPGSRLAGGFPTSAGHSGVVAQPASA